MTFEQGQIVRHETVPEAEQLRMLCGAYRDRYNARLEEFFSRGEVNMQELAEIFWRCGVVDRLVPEDSRECIARRLLGRDVFEGSATDPELFWRLLGATASRDKINGESSSWISRPIEFTLTKLLNTNPDLFDDFFGVGDARIDVDAWFTDIVRLRARDTLTAYGVLRPELPEVGSLHSYRGFAVRIAGYTYDGLAVLMTEDPKDQLKFVELQSPKGSAVSPGALIV